MKNYRIKILIMSLLLAMALAAGTCFAEDFSGDPDPETAVPILIDEEVPCSISKPGGFSTYSFTPAEGGKYEFFSFNLLDDRVHDTYGLVMVYNDEEKRFETVAESSSGGAGSHFSIGFDAAAGTTYYLKARYTDDQNTGEFGVKVTRTGYIEPEANTLVVTPSKKTYKLTVKALKKKAKVVKPFEVRTPQGTVSYNVSVSGKSRKHLSFRKGKVTIKKGTKKGKYTMTVKVTAAGNENYLPMTKSCRITVVVK